MKTKTKKKRKKEKRQRISPKPTEDRRQLQQLPDGGNGTDGSQVLMADDGLRHAFGLRSRRGPTGFFLVLQQLQREEPADELEAQLRVLVLGDSPDVVEHAREEVGLVREGPVREGEAVLLDGEAVVVDAARVVVDRLGQVVECVFVDALRQLRGGDRGVGDQNRVGRGVDSGVDWRGIEEGLGGGGHRREAVQGDWVGHGWARMLMVMIW